MRTKCDALRRLGDGLPGLWTLSLDRPVIHVIYWTAPRLKLLVAISYYWLLQKLSESRLLQRGSLSGGRGVCAPDVQDVGNRIRLKFGSAVNLDRGHDMPLMGLPPAGADDIFVRFIGCFLFVCFQLAKRRNLVPHRTLYILASCVYLRPSLAGVSAGLQGCCCCLRLYSVPYSVQRDYSQSDCQLPALPDYERNMVDVVDDVL